MVRDGCIVLDRSRNSRAFGDKESLWRRELERILRRIREHRQSLLAAGETATRDEQPFLSIAIFGPSGSGKSSLLRTLVKSANREVGDLEERGLTELVHSLPVMQPDRFAEHDHFLYAFLATALKEEKEWREHRVKRGLDFPSSGERRYEADALSPVQQRFQELSDFLRVIDEPEKSRDYDPLGLSLERLERHTSALLLKERMSLFINSLANELAGRSAGNLDSSLVLLPVDDADMSPEHLVTALQIYQTYLLHPRLVPVFTFTDRTAEEILRGYFHQHMFTVPDHGSDGAPGVPMAYASPGEGTRRLPVGDQLALQYLARCFPVRNRIRLGPAPARFRAKTYIARQGNRKTRQAERPVKGLLLTASQLLYGVVGREARHQIRAALRPSTLRRQFHVVDEMVAAKMEYFLLPEVSDPYDPGRKGPRYCKDDTSTKSSKSLKPRWVEVFDRAAWALMNVHRDVLREYDLYLEDLYSWTPQGLRRLLLETILSQPIEMRRALLRRWRFRLSSRRGETLSLLAANVFRPWIPGEEPSGDDQVMRAYDQRDFKRVHVEEGKSSLSAPTALLWFLNLLNGFYQPLVLAWNRPNDIAVSNPQKGRVVGLGWNLESGPVNAIRAAEANDSVAAAGMLFLDPDAYAAGLSWGNDPQRQRADDPKDRQTDHDAVLFLRCWTFYGYSRGRYWSALSFWRGLGLIGQLLEARHQIELEMLAETLEHPEALAEQDEHQSGRLSAGPDGGTPRSELWLDETHRDRLGKEVEGILRNHLIRGLVPGQLVGEGEAEGRLDVVFRRWDLTPVHYDKKTAPSQSRTLVNRLVDWLLGPDTELTISKATATATKEPKREWRALLSYRTADMIDVIPRANPEEMQSEVGENPSPWTTSLLRRLHGDDIVGSLLTRLNATIMDDQDLFGTEISVSRRGRAREDDTADSRSPEERHRWSAGIAMTAWTRVFLDYWRGLGPMQDLLRTCPLLAPFAEGPATDRFRRHTVTALFDDHGTKGKVCKEVLQRRVHAFRKAWKPFEPPSGSEERPAANAGSRPEALSSEDLAAKLAEHLGDLREPRGEAETVSPWKGPAPGALGVEDDELEDLAARFRKRVGLRAVGAPVSPGGSPGEPRDVRIERKQIDDLMASLAGTALFYGMSRARPDALKPSEPISAPTTRIKVTEPVTVIKYEKERSEDLEPTSGAGPKKKEKGKSSGDQ